MMDKLSTDVLGALDDIPDSMAQLYCRLIDRVRPHERVRTLTLLQWVLVAKDELLPLDICIALSFASAESPTSFESWKRSPEAILDEKTSRIIDRSTFLWHNPYQFLAQRGMIRRVNSNHNTVYKFLRRTISPLLIGKSTHAFSDLGHRTVATIGANILSTNEVQGRLCESDERQAKSHHLCEYAARYYGRLKSSNI
jgi:hypothetical protein